MPAWVRDLWPLWLIFGLLLAAGIYGFFGRRADQRRAKAMVDWAKRSGFEVWGRPYGGFFSPGNEPDEVTRDFVKRFENFAGLDFRDRSCVGPLARGMVDGIPVEAFYVTSVVRSGSQTLYFRWTVAMAAVPMSLPKMRIRSETMLSRGLTKLGKMDIQLDSKKFNDRYKVEGEDEGRVREALDATMQDLMLAFSRDRDWQISHQLIVLAEPQLQDPASLDLMLEDAVRFAKRLPKHLFEKYPAPF